LFYFASLVAAGIGNKDSCVSAIVSIGPTVFVAEAHRCDGQRFIVRSDDKLTAFVTKPVPIKSHLLYVI
jgi:hypothetical protein